MPADNMETMAAIRRLFNPPYGSRFYHIKNSAQEGRKLTKKRRFFMKGQSRFLLCKDSGVKSFVQRAAA